LLLPNSTLRSDGSAAEIVASSVDADLFSTCPSSNSDPLFGGASTNTASLGHHGHPHVFHMTIYTLGTPRNNREMMLPIQIQYCRIAKRPGADPTPAPMRVRHISPCGSPLRRASAVLMPEESSRLWCAWASILSGTNNLTLP